MTVVRTYLRCLGVAALPLTLAACRGSTPDLISPLPTTSAIPFSTTMVAGGSAARSFAMDRSGKITIQYASMSPQTDVPLRMSLGRFADAACTPITTIDTPPTSTPQITTDLAAGNYCVSVQDLGGVSQISVFSVLILINFNS